MPAVAPAVPPSSHTSSASPRTVRQQYTVVVVGNPNTGKTTLFNALTGLTQHTGNYPGVTVESALGEFTVDGRLFLAVDLPGTYSLSPRAPDEMVAVNILLGRNPTHTPPDVVLCVLDATNLDRNLYLFTQVVELGRPVVVALTMVDLAHKQGIEIDIPALADTLGVPVVPVQANRRIGVPALKQAVSRAARTALAPRPCVHFPPSFTQAVADLSQVLEQHDDHLSLSHFLVQRLLADAGGPIERAFTDRWGATGASLLYAARRQLAATGTSASQIEVESRYHWISAVVARTVRRSPVGTPTWSDRIDRIVTHKLWGMVIFLGVMAITFQSIFSWAVPVMDAIDVLFQSLGRYIAHVFPEGPVRSLVVDGVIGGVGAVIVFVPQIAVLFGLIAILEDSGYMARAAFLMDRVMASFGLSGRSFIPLLSSFACAVPGIMATRTIEDRRDRITTILIAPLMSCSARLPVYVLFISAFIPAQTLWGIVGLQGLTLFALYVVGLAVAPLVALTLKRTVFRGEPVPFLLELPPFKIPAWRVVLFRMYDRSWAFIRRAGTIILATTVLVWAVSYYPNQAYIAEEYRARRALASPEEQERLQAEEAGARLRESFLGQAGRAIAPIVHPLGWDWKIGMATLASFPAREAVIAALGTIYNLGSGQGEGSVELREAMRTERWPDGRPVYTPAVALSLMVFFALCCQCGATLATIKRETGSWWYAAFTFTYMTAFAYLSALAVYQIGNRLIGS